MALLVDFCCNTKQKILIIVHQTSPLRSRSLIIHRTHYCNRQLQPSSRGLLKPGQTDTSCLPIPYLNWLLSLHLQFKNSFSFLIYFVYHYYYYYFSWGKYEQYDPVILKRKVCYSMFVMQHQHCFQIDYSLVIMLHGA